MPGKWGGACQARPPRSANELGCQANGGRAPGAPPPRSANDQYRIAFISTFFNDKLHSQYGNSPEKTERVLENNFIM